MELKQTFPDLYKQDSKKKIRIWRMELGTDGFGQWGHRTVAGIMDGKLVTSGWTTCEAKNEGKKNATSPEKQAIKEIENLYERKLDLTYFRDITDVEKVHYTEPMLASSYPERKNRFDITEGVWAQPKLDGIRCIARVDGLWTRKGKPILSCPHLVDALAPFFAHSPDAVLDGELYNHYFADNFNQITSIVRKTKPTEADLARSAQYMQYNVYDWVSDKPFGSRLKGVKGAVDFVNNPMVVSVPTVWVAAQSALDTLYADWLAEGYEGQMVRLDDPHYAAGKRSPALMKRKEFHSNEFTVLRMEEGNGNWAGAVKKLIVRLPDGTENDATPRGSYDDMVAMLKHGRVPTWATVRYLGNTPDGKLRCPVAVDWGFGDDRAD